jgi:hypothetical protein
MRLPSTPSFALLLSCLLHGCAEDAIQPSTDVTDSAGADTLVAIDTASSPDTGAPIDTAIVPTDGDPPPDTTPLPDGGTATSPDCDLNGRWLLSQHTVATALGQTQASHNWFYYEITQVGDAVTVTKGLHCGYQVNKISTFGASVSSQKAWPAFLTHCSDTGRKGTFKLTGSTCTFGLDKQYAVRGASLPFYLDPSKPLPGKSAQATGGTPGWEDWEPDTKAGITLSVTGTASGELYLVQRDWTQYAGSVPLKTAKFMVPITWDTEASVLGSTNSIIETKGVPDSNKSLHYVWWAKLGAGQATGTDTAICEAVRSLKGTLVPEADKD